MDRLSAYAKAPSRDRPLTGARTAPQKDFDDYIDFIAPPRPSVARSSFSDDIDFAMSMELPSIDFGESMELSSAMSMESLSCAGVSASSISVTLTLSSFRQMTQSLVLFHLETGRMWKLK